ncbi:hypothetical protein IQ273_32435 [Nodosilinea sp. LEGE 07298]|uniref:hypothetical protein n=1 Tax=Nodosilinea sp. LEGE 07298 TaxID=2777970 RepID=UPI001882043F|nr:hypothetical protein [Nodosilinea sp. LEGE 07298]MBE9114074.1 hypothetical protein [Nodosilinea sp. LEGE 07298]
MNFSALNRPLFLAANYPPHRAWKFYSLWVGLTVLGCGLAIISIPAEQPRITPYVLGAAVGLLQGSMLRLGASGTVRWTLATMLGVVLSSMVRPYVAFHSSLIMSGAVGGIIIGGIQGLVFYTQIPGMAWWALVQVISGAVSWGLGWFILGSVSRAIGHTPTGLVLTSSVAIDMMWGISATITGMVMYRLLALRHGRRTPLPPPES